MQRDARIPQVALPSHTSRQFARALVPWQRRHGRNDLPWQETRDPYRIWLSEIMLQQTQVSTVVPYYRRFLDLWPDVHALAAARLDDVLAAWSGLGYYARARHLHRAACEVVVRHGGHFPSGPAELATLPGIGRSTAAAIAAFAFGVRAAILDGNVKRVLARCFGIGGFPGTSAVEARLWAVAQALLPRRNVARYTQALMDLGALVCTRHRPRCTDCPVRELCIARRESLIETIPAPRPRAVRPHRRERWLVLRQRDTVLVERRPRTGLWGGLWTFPVAEADAALRTQARRLTRGTVLRRQALPALEHEFTHFRLSIAPFAFDIDAPAAPPDGERRWVSLARLLAMGVPVPVRRIAARLLSTADAPQRARGHRGAA